MNYHPDDFLALIEEVEDQGGAHLSTDTCKGEKFRLDQPIDPDNPSGPKRSETFKTTGCERRALFLVALADEANFLDNEEAASDLFDFDDAKHPIVMMSDGETPALAKVCAVDDSMGLWPRFMGAMHTGDSFEVS